ncbi:restriction endonuclease subunit S [Massilia timonae]|uniref:restriction endonuclease subunit S n=1 Tax=Massilia timonae TaxID=47229 RepID=UPI00235309F1|nr:restriction endonuclease subunit S [Massilia timonae]
MSTLPKGWVSTTVKSLAGTSGLFVDGDWVESKDQDPNGDIRLLQLADIGDGVFLDKSDRWINEEAFTRLRCTELGTGDVLIARMPDPLGRACLMPSLEQRCVTVVDVAALRVNPQLVDNRWVMHTVNSPQLRAEISAQASGTTRKRISRGNLGGLQIPLPPESEQKRIADKLDSVLTRVDALNTRLARVAPILKRFRQSVLAAATSGEMTADWRGRAQSNWPTLSAEQVCAKVQSGGTPKAGFLDAGIPFLKVYNIVDQKVAFDYKPQYVSAEVNNTELRKSQVQPGDVLMNIVGPPLGKVAIVPADHSTWNINQAITLFRPSEQISSQWIYFVLCEGTPIREVLNRTKGSVGQVNISLSQCRAFELPVPPVDEQAEIARRVEILFAFADRLESRLQAAQTATERLTPAMLSKAFRGELVPQDPFDEPASDLLRRLQHEVPSTSTNHRRTSAA